MPSRRHDPADCLADIVENAEQAVYRLADRAEALMPGHPWADIRGMGNRLRHAYDRLDLDVMWNTARERIPALAADARRALERLEGGGEAS